MTVFDNLVNDLIGPFWLMLSPFIATLFFVVMCGVLVVCAFAGFRKSDSKVYLFFLLSVVISGLYLLFNVYDLYRYRKYGLAISSINQCWYFLFLAPSDLYEPYSVMSLSPSSDTYIAHYRHRYGGEQKIVLNLINNTPKEFEYGNPDKIDLSFKCSVSCPDSGKNETFTKTYTTYYLRSGTNSLSLCQYNIDDVDSLSFSYNVEIQIGGNITDFLARYPGSYITVRNGTTK